MRKVEFCQIIFAEVPKMNQKGIIVVHDYTNPALPGVKKAVDEYLDRQISNKSVARIIKLW